MKCLVIPRDLKSKKGIYQIRQISSGKVYVGSTVRNFYDRLCAHRSVLRRNKHSSIYLQRSWNQYGEDDFVFEILEDIDDISNILKTEMNYINLLKSSNPEFGFNIAKEVSPNRLGHIQNDLTRRRISSRLKGVQKSEQARANIREAKIGENNPMWGKKQSKEFIDRRMRNLRKKIRRSDGIVFTSIKEAAECLGCRPQSISSALRSGRKCRGYLFYYEEHSSCPNS